MTTRREPTSQRDDAPVRVVGHRLQQVDGLARASSNANIQQRSASPSQHRSPTTADSKSKSAPNNSAVLRQIVLVDREIDALRDIAIALRDEYDFHITISGAEALNLLRDGVIDTIVVGQTLYSSTGLSVLAEARQHAPHTHRVLLANAVEASSIGRGASASPFQVMQRPCTADKLRELLEAQATPLEAPLAPTERSDSTINSQKNLSPARLNEAAYSRSADTHDPADFEHVVMETAPPRARVQIKPTPKSTGDALPAIVYTDNGEFYQAITLALQDRHEVRLCTQLDRAAELAEMGMCPLLITDRANTEVELQRIAIPLRALDAGMITIAAGTPEVGASLRKLLGTDALHSFLPKPINAPLARLAVESGKRHYLQSRALRESEPHLLPPPTARKAKPAAKPQASQSAPPVPLYMPGYRNDFSVDDFNESPWRQAAPKIALVTVIALAALAGAWYGWREYSRPPSNAELVTKEIELAQRAFDGNRYATADGAIYHYNQALLLAPQDPRALVGLDHTVERIIELAETALMAEHLDAAADAIATVRAVEPTHKRLPFLESQLEKARRQLTAKSEARNTASTAALANDSAPISNETQRQQLIARWLATARQRLAQNRLLTPENDSAEFYFRQVERADPGNASMQQGLREVGARLLSEAREALSRQQLQLAKRRTDEAIRFGVDNAAISQLQADIAAASSSATRTNFLRLALQRTRDNQLFDPDRDSAKYYLGQLQQLDPTSVETAQATRALGLKLIENADYALAQQQMSTATQLLNEARRLGFNGNELAAAEARARTARTPAPQSSNITIAAAPKVIKVMPAKFPEEAMRAGVAGWVDVSFHITASGDVTNAVPVASNPPGQFAAQFERAAVAAIRQYKFEPRTLTDTQTQTMVVRVQFKLQ